MPRTRKTYQRMEVDLAHPEAFAPRRGEMFRLLATGMTLKEVARELDVSPETVAWHLDELKDQFCATSRVDLINQAWMHGLLQARTAVAILVIALCLLSAMPMARTRTTRTVQTRPAATRQIGRREIAPLYT